MKKVKVFSPATVANLGCGFDVMGLTLGKIGDVITIAIIKEMAEQTNTENTITGTTYFTNEHLHLKIKNKTSENLPLKAEENVITPALVKMAERYYKKNNLKEPLNVKVTIEKKIRPGSGIGSSAASSAAAVYGLNKLLENPFSEIELVEFAMEGEKLIGGSYHADNVAPAIMGGATFIRGYEPLDIIKLPVPDNFFCTVVHPHIAVSTKQAREILPKEISRKDAIIQWGNVGGLVAGFLTNNIELIGRSVKDVVAEPYRKGFIPGYDNLKEELLGAGALAVNISGSGPSIFALSTSKSIAAIAGNIMEDHFRLNGVKAEVYITQVDNNGSQIIG